MKRRHEKVRRTITYLKNKEAEVIDGGVGEIAKTGGESATDWIWKVCIEA